VTAPADLKTISTVIDIQSLPEAGAEYKLEPNDDERRAIAARLDVQSVDTLRGEFAIRAVRGGVEIEMRINATVGRICVSSLEPMTEAIDEKIKISFERNYSEDIECEDQDDILREPLDGEDIDIGELLVQHLSLGLDPYPRKAGALGLVDKYRDAASTSPFDALKGLAKRET
jgi:uncharacterized metal-binding protein YceD (DUF177 family)